MLELVITGEREYGSGEFELLVVEPKTGYTLKMISFYLLILEFS